MYQYIFDEDTTNKIQKNTSNSKNIFDRFTEIDNKYANIGANNNTSLNLQKKSYEKPSQEQVELDATNSLTDYKNSSINSINETFDDKDEKLNENIEKAKESSQNTEKTIKTNYENAKQNAKDDAVARGLARSSIIVNTLNNLDNNMLNALNENLTSLNNAISNYEIQKQNLELEKQNALNSFNIEYAVKLQDKINEINTSILKKEEEVLEYNNKIEQQQAEWDKKTAQDNLDYNKDLLELYSKYGENVFDIVKQMEKYKVAESFFNNMSKEDALLELENNSNYINQLGRSLYNKLYSSIKAK